MTKGTKTSPDSNKAVELIRKALDADASLAFLSQALERFSDSEWYLVGGAVRDAILKRSDIKDFDFLVRQVSLEELSAFLGDWGDVNLVGRSFGVLRFRPRVGAGETLPEFIDIAWPRTERAGMTGGYRDFEIQSDPELPVERDLERRDFTVNAMAFNLRTGELTDPHGGMADLKSKTIRAVGDPDLRFREDYSRMLRAIRQACQLGFEIEESSWQSLRHLIAGLEEKSGDGQGFVVPRETVAKEMVKAFRADAVRATSLLEESGALFRLIGELKGLVGCGQEGQHHHEGDAWQHTRLTIAALASKEFQKEFPDSEILPETLFAALLHDIGKPSVRRLSEDGQKATFYGHDQAGARLTKSIAKRLRLSSVAEFDSELLEWLVRHHMFLLTVDLKNVKRTTLYRYFLERPEAGQALLQLSLADMLASQQEDGSADAAKFGEVMAVLKPLQDRTDPEGSLPELISGHQVMETAGLASGPEIGRILEKLNEAQLKGEVSSAEEAKEFLRQLTAQA